MVGGKEMIQISRIIYIFDNSKLITAYGNHQRKPRSVSNAFFKNYPHELGDIFSPIQS